MFAHLHIYILKESGFIPKKTPTYRVEVRAARGNTLRKLKIQQSVVFRERKKEKTSSPPEMCGPRVAYEVESPHYSPWKITAAALPACT